VTDSSSLAALLFEHPLDDAEPLLHGPHVQLTAGDARQAARDTARRLAEAGVRPGDAVAVALPDGPELVTTMVGVWDAGAVFVPVNRRASDAERQHLFASTGAAVLVGPDFAATGRLEPTQAEPRRYATGDAFILFTSGTTGAPKPIIHTHEGYLELLDRVLGPLRGAGRDPARPPMPNLIPVSLALNAGIYNVLFGLRAGAPLVIMDGFDTRTFANLVHRFAIRSTVLPPAAITMLSDDPEVTGLAPLRYVRSITAPLSPVEARRFRDAFGVFVLNSYGQAEVGEVIGWTAADAKEHPEKIGAAGRPLPGVDIRLAPLEDTDADGTGELLVRPPSMAAGYASGAELGDRLADDGFLHTGDIARVDTDGFVWIEGRLGDLINRGGNKVLPEQVEEVLRRDPAVTDVAVAGVPDRRLGEVPVAFVVARGPVDAGELEARCRAQLTPYKVPVAFVVVDALPRNDAGKVLRRELAAAYDASREKGTP
jgi:acyl-coenzyme A synthetase/AMP-(fatty) acid ligase